MAYERLVPGTKEWDLYYANHQSRYSFAVGELEKISGSNILDAATGVGYGAHYLAQHFPQKQLLAIDRNEEALQIAKAQFKSTNLLFLYDDCEKFDSVPQHAPFDAIISFETLEHLPNPEKFLQNCFNVLGENGLLVISTPNQWVSSPDGKNAWEFHEKEYKPEELIDLLSAQGFTNIHLYGQQLTAIGLLRQQMRGELNKLHSNPFTRIGKKLQTLVKGTRFKSILPEQPEDFEIVPYPDTNVIAQKGVKGPFVLIAVCSKQS